MSRRFILFSALALALVPAVTCSAQINDICAEAGIMPGLDSPFAHIPYVFGKVLVGVPAGAKFPRVTIELQESGQNAIRQTITRSGNYCFRRRSTGGNLIITIDGTEASRRALPTVGIEQDREDFELSVSERSAPPGAISAKFPYTRTDKTRDLYERAGAASRSKQSDEAAALLAEIVKADPKDFIAWAELGDQYFLTNKYSEADNAYRRSLELKVDYTPAWINVGQLRVAQKQFSAAIEIFKHATELEPNAPKIFRLLGEAYLQAKQGTLGADALNKAIELDPIGMAECHLMLAHLYELAGAKPMATKEYKAFLKKVPDYADRKRLEKFIKDNPE